VQRRGLRSNRPQTLVCRLDRGPSDTNLHSYLEFAHFNRSTGPLSPGPKGFNGLKLAAIHSHRERVRSPQISA
jgi:hypothetical protein